ncbi:hypothetical protein BMR09_16190, partial [Methylococcaceae bacterium CS3]
CVGERITATGVPEFREVAWRAYQIGLTATPKETEEVSNIDYFGEPVFTYTLKQGQARHATSQHSGTPVTNIHSPTQRMGDALVALRPSQLRTKPCSVKTTSNGWTAIRNAILASLARY